MRPTLAALVLVPLLAACGGSEEASGTRCGTLPTANPAATLPAGFPALPGQVLHEPARQGKTDLVLALVHETDFVAVRDDLVARLRAAGFQVPGTDQEAVEAEAEFTGPHEGTIKVTPLCEGYVTVRYKFTG